MCKWWKSIHTHECALQSWNVFFVWKLFLLPVTLLSCFFLLPLVSLPFSFSCLLLSMQCKWGEIALSSKFQLCLTGTKNSFFDSVEGRSTEIPGLHEIIPEIQISLHCDFCWDWKMATPLSWTLSIFLLCIMGLSFWPRKALVYFQSIWLFSCCPQVLNHLQNTEQAVKATGVKRKL